MPGCLPSKEKTPVMLLSSSHADNLVAINETKNSNNPGL